MVKAVFSLLIFSLVFPACKHQAADDDEMTSHDIAGFKGGAVANVKVTHVQQQMIGDTLKLFGTTRYLKKANVQSPISGYVKSLNVNVGDAASVGSELMTLQTKEAAAYSHVTDSFQSKGLIHVKSFYDYVVTEIHAQPGEYVQEGSALITMVNPSSIVVQVNVPFEMNSFIQMGNSGLVRFADGTAVTATVWKKLPEVDPSAQTQQCLLKMNSSKSIPEDLNVSVSFVKTTLRKAMVLPKSAVLSNETQTEFWVMKLMNDSTAVKVNVQMGLQNAGMIEILSPSFQPDDKIIIEGNYGLSDTAKVKVR
ncbi:MAG: HlyD family efflux transporter periplasmic adaptor subunit [Chitinophagales bacterium]|nr:HlyD family efflux transporter periplasmic adaptor subunit [Chitinophagales bacterium]